MKARNALVLVLVLLVLLPGCGIIGFALACVNWVLDVLCFWAAPAPPGDSPLPTAAEGPMALPDALRVAAAEGADGRRWIVPADRLGEFDPGPPPFPGAVLRTIPIRAER